MVVIFFVAVDGEVSFLAFALSVYLGSTLVLSDVEGDEVQVQNNIFFLFSLNNAVTEEASP